MQLYDDLWWLCDNDLWQMYDDLLELCDVWWFVMIYGGCVMICGV